MSANSKALWTLAFLVTAGSAVYQRMTGPSYPLRGEAVLAGQRVRYRLPRTQTTGRNLAVRLPAGGAQATAALVYRRYRAGEDWTVVPMRREAEEWAGELPHQPPAGKLEYFIEVTSGGAGVRIPARGTAVARFKGNVPLPVLVVHVFAMFFGMLLSTRAGIESLRSRGDLKRLTYITLILLAIGGGFLGPVVQKYAFGAFWTGWPLGTDLTDNKTAVAILVWAAAAVAVARNRNPRAWVLAAAIVTLAIFVIPHSAFGSELDYSRGRLRGT